MLLYLEYLAFAFEHYGYVDVERRVAVFERIVVGVLHVTSRPLLVGFDIDVLADKRRVEVFETEEASRTVYHRVVLACRIDHEQRCYACGTSHAVVVCTERRRDMDDTRTVRSGNVVARDYAERIAEVCHRLYPRNQLFVADSLQVLALVYFSADLERTLHLLGEVCRYEVFRHDYGLFGVGVRIAALDAHVLYRRTDAQRRVRRQRPRSGRPCEEEEFALHVVEQKFAAPVTDDAELRRAGRVLHVAVTPRLVQLVGRESGSGSGRVWLDGVALVEQPLFVQFF